MHERQKGCLSMSLLKAFADFQQCDDAFPCSPCTKRFKKIGQAEEECGAPNKRCAKLRRTIVVQDPSHKGGGKDISLSQAKQHIP
jgi:hypothetical protein